MTRDPFLRLALIAAATLYVVALLAVGRTFGWWASGVALVGGVALAAAATVVLDRDEHVQPAAQRRERQPAHGTRGFDRIQ